MYAYVYTQILRVEGSDGQHCHCQLPSFFSARDHPSLSHSMTTRWKWHVLVQLMKRAQGRRSEFCEHTELFKGHAKLPAFQRGKTESHTSK